MKTHKPIVDVDILYRWRFFMAHAGYATPPGRAMCALSLARAERWLSDHSELTVIWYDDDDPDLSWMDDDERRKDHTVECCAIVRACADHGLDCKHARFIASLGNIVDADANYQRLVSAELASEIMDSYQEN